MKRDNDEVKIKELFEAINTPSYDILRGVKKMKKTTRPRFSVALVAAVALLVITAGTVLAYFGGFARLRGIVGDEHADMLTPIEVELGAEGFATPFVPGYNPLEDELRIEIVAVNVGDGYMDIYVTLEDLTGGRAGCEFNRLSYQLHTRCNSHMYDFTGGSFYADDIIHQESGILTLRTRHEFGTDEVIVDGEITVTFLEIMYNFTGYIDNFPLPIDLAALPVNPPYRRITFDETPAGASLPFCPDGENYFAYVLEPFQLDIPVGAPGINARVSSAGIIDGNLHVQIYQPRPTYSAFHVLRLTTAEPREREENTTSREYAYDPDGVRHYFRSAGRGDTQIQANVAAFSDDSIMFNLRPDGTAYQISFSREAKFPLFTSFFFDNQFQEFIWRGVENPISLTGTFSNSDNIWLDWTASFSLPLPLPQH